MVVKQSETHFLFLEGTERRGHRNLVSSPRFEHVFGRAQIGQIVQFEPTILPIIYFIGVATGVVMMLLLTPRPEVRYVRVRDGAPADEEEDDEEEEAEDEGKPVEDKKKK